LKIKSEEFRYKGMAWALRAPMSAEATAIITFRILSQTDDFVLIKLKVKGLRMKDEGLRIRDEG
jgi:hypothetical protein